MSPILLVWLLAGGDPAPKALAPVKLVYLAPAGVDGWAKSFDFEVRKLDAGFIIRGVTGPAKKSLTVEATYDANYELRGASATLKGEAEDKAAAVGTYQHPIELLARAYAG